MIHTLTANRRSARPVLLEWFCFEKIAVILQGLFTNGF